MEKHVFSKKWVRFWGGASGPQTLYFTTFSNDFPCQKNAFVGPSWAPPDTKTELWCESGDDFRGYAFEPSRWVKIGQKSVKMGQESLVMAPDSTHHTHLCTHSLKTNCQSQTSNNPKGFRCRPYVYGRQRNDLSFLGGMRWTILCSECV